MPRQVFKLLLDFLYSDSVDPRIDPEVAHDVLCAASLYSLPRLARLAEGRLIRFVDEDNAVSMVKFADLFGTELLNIAARAVILRNWATVSE